MIECGVERVLYSMLCVGMCVDLPTERASLLRLLAAGWQLVGTSLRFHVNSDEEGTCVIIKPKLKVAHR
jgi:hypothetical protein